MNELILKSSSLFNKNLGKVSITSVRFRRVGPCKQSQGKPRVEKYYGLKGIPGIFCNEVEVIATQKNLKFHPGLNTCIDPNDNAIYSICAGTLLVTTEKFEPDPKNSYNQKYYKDLKGNLYKRYIHVLPIKPKGKFKLCNLI